VSTDSLHCPDCGYNLFGIDSDRCPECGLPIDRSILGESRLPWMHRHKIGRVRAFLRTVVLATVRPRKIAEEVNRPVSYADAIKFRRICLLLAILPLLLGIGLTVWTSDMGIFWWESTGLVVACGFSAWLFLLAITGLPSLFCHPKSLPVLRQNRAIALSFYAAAPLAWMILPTVILGLCVFVFNGPNRWFPGAETLLAAGYGLLLLLFAAQGNSSFVLLKHTTLRSASRRWIIGICLAICYIALFWIVAIGIPMIAIYVDVMIHSLI
jgi:hypothetical protein